jgi:undecaprenyl-diphosphatase
MTLTQSFLLGIIQGLTEFIPVSSTAHLLIAQKLLGIPANDAVFSFLILVQWGTLVSLFIYFRTDLWQIGKALFKNPLSAPQNSPTRLAWYLLLATIPALLIGYLLKDALETLFATPLLAASIRLFAAALLLTLAERYGRRVRGIEEMTWLDALIVGLFQIFAVFPGASRSGSTIAGGMFRGFTRKAAARFAFLMSIPVMLAAGAYESLDLLAMPGLGDFLPVLLLGFFTAALVGWLAIRWLMDYLNNHSLASFARYCAILGTVVLGLYFLGI